MKKTFVSTISARMPYVRPLSCPLTGIVLGTMLSASIDEDNSAETEDYVFDDVWDLS